MRQLLIDLQETEYDQRIMIKTILEKLGEPVKAQSLAFSVVHTMERGHVLKFLPNSGVWALGLNGQANISYEDFIEQYKHVLEDEPQEEEEAFEIPSSANYFETKGWNEPEYSYEILKETGPLAFGIINNLVPACWNTETGEVSGAGDLEKPTPISFPCLVMNLDNELLDTVYSSDAMPENSRLATEEERNSLFYQED